MKKLLASSSDTAFTRHSIKTMRDITELPCDSSVNKASGPLTASTQPAAAERQKSTEKINLGRDDGTFWTKSEE